MLYYELLGRVAATNLLFGQPFAGGCLSRGGREQRVECSTLSQVPCPSQAAKSPRKEAGCGTPHFPRIEVEPWPMLLWLGTLRGILYAEKFCGDSVRASKSRDPRERADVRQCDKGSALCLWESSYVPFPKGPSNNCLIWPAKQSVRKLVGCSRLIHRGRCLLLLKTYLD